MGSKDLTDGEWIWPEGLPHYVDTHGIALPDSFLASARAKAFRVPPFDLDALFADASATEWMEHGTIHGQTLETMVSDERWLEWTSRKLAGRPVA